MLMSFIVWMADPEIFSFLPIRWYGLLFALGFILSQQVMYYIYKKEGKPVKDIDTITVFLIIATIIGARFGHILFYEPHILLERPLEVFLPVRFTPEFKFVGLQGLASHGGAAGILIALWLYCRYDISIKKFKLKIKKIKRKGQSYLQVLDRIVIVVALTGFMIRMGNFINSEIIGKPTKSSYGVVFARNAVDGLTGDDSPVESVELRKRTGEPVNTYQPVFMILKFKNGNYDEEGIAQYLDYNVHSTLTNYSYISEHIYQPANEPLDYSIKKKSGVFQASINTYAIPRHPAQLYESISSLLLFFILFGIWSMKKNNTPTGRIFGIFLILLFGLRFIYEFIKENQVSFEDNIPLNMGQWLSIPLVIAGVIVLLRSYSKTHSANKGHL